MQINIKYNVGEKIKRLRNCFATTSHSGSSTEQILLMVGNQNSTMSAKMNRLAILSH